MCLAANDCDPRLVPARGWVAGWLAPLPHLSSLDCRPPAEQQLLLHVHGSFLYTGSLLATSTAALRIHTVSVGSDLRGKYVTSVSFLVVDTKTRRPSEHQTASHLDFWELV